MKVNPTLEQIVIEKIRQQGPIAFRDFMEMALYYPGLGYYTSGKARIGQSGDFYTSPWLGPLFGEMLARQLEEMWSFSGKKDFRIVEFGGGSGNLCRDILGFLSGRPLYDHLQYHIIEKEGRLAENDRLNVPGKLSWHHSIKELAPVKAGCILSNELIDNFPVSLVIMEGELLEVYVDYKDGRFVEELRPAPAALKDYFDELGVVLPGGFRTEVNLQAIGWLKDIAQLLRAGFVLTIDYGFPSPELYSPARRAGTLLCYHRHTVNDDPYVNIGEQDITTHVNFSALRHWGDRYGLSFCGYTSQANFLLGLGLAEHLREKELQQPSDVDAGKRAILLHQFLAGMGRKFRVLAQSKGLTHPSLSGLRFPMAC